HSAPAVCHYISVLLMRPRRETMSPLRSLTLALRQLEDRHCLRLPLHLDPAAVMDLDAIRHRGERSRADQDLGTEIAVERLDPRHGVHGIAQDRVLLLARRAYVAHERLAGVDGHAHGQWRPALGHPLDVQS